MASHYATRIILAIFLSTPLLFSQRLLKLEDMHRFHDVREVQISPDGKWVAYTVTSVDVKEDKSDTDVWMVSWDGTQQMRLTSSPENENAPRWSPDGRYLAFLSGRPGKAKGTQVWLLARIGATPRQVTHYDGVHSSASRSRPEWSPDGAKLAYLQSSGAKQGAYNMNRLAVAPAAGGEPKLLAGKFDRGISAPR